MEAVKTVPEIVEFEDGSTPKPTINLPATIREVEKDSFVETFTVHDHGKKYEVAANAVANRAMMQINVAKLRALCDETIKVYTEGKIAPSPKDLKAICDSVALVESMSEGAYSDKKGGGQLANSLERLAYAVTRGAIDGASAKHGQNHTPMARMNRMVRIGKKTSGEAIDIEPKK
jgi:hypothetical protein